jgi:hypothetical protein
VDGWVGKDPCWNEEPDKAWMLGGILSAKKKSSMIREDHLKIKKQLKRARQSKSTKEKLEEQTRKQTKQ